MKNNKKRIITIIFVITILVILCIIITVFVLKLFTRDKKIIEQSSIINRQDSRNEEDDKKMIGQVSNIISQVKENERTKINSVYKLDDIKNMGIDIPISPYGTEYTKGSYVKNFNGVYYASFDNGKQKVSGNEDGLEFSEKGSLSVFWDSDYSYNITEDEKRIFVKEKLKNKYNEEFEIDNIESSVNYLAQYDGDYGKAYPVKYGKNKSFDFHIYKFERMTDGYYDILIKDDYKNLIMNGINKIDSRAKLIYFSNDTYGDEVSIDLSLKEALKKQVINKEIYIVTYSNLKDTDINNIKKHLLEINYSGLFHIYQTKKEMYLKINDMEEPNLLQYATLYSFYISEGKVDNENTKVLDKYGT